MLGVRFLAGAGQVGVEGWRPTSGRWPSSIPARSMIEGHRTLELAQRPTGCSPGGSITGDPPVGDDPNAMGPGWSSGWSRRPTRASSSWLPGSWT